MIDINEIEAYALRQGYTTYSVLWKDQTDRPGAMGVIGFGSFKSQHNFFEDYKTTPGFIIEKQLFRSGPEAKALITLGDPVKKIKTLYGTIVRGDGLDFTIGTDLYYSGILITVDDFY